MKLSFKLFEYKGTPIYINMLFLALFLFLPVNVTLFIFIAILLHEMGHIYMAKKLNYNVEKGFVSIFGGGAIVDESYTNNDKHAIKIALAGPIVNIIISMFCFILGIIFLNYDFLFENILILLSINLILAFLNLVPIFPLDGGRVLLHTLSIYLSKKTSINISVFTSIILSISLFFYAISQSDFLLIAFTILFVIFNLMRLKHESQ
jgi:stage IV sporulation protein FB